MNDIDLLYNLVYSPTFLDQISHRGTAKSSVGDTLAYTDLAEIAAAATTARRHVLRSGGATGRGIEGSFPRTLSRLASHGFSAVEIISGFVESEDFAAYHDVPYSSEGVLLEEAFYTFLRAWNPPLDDRNSYRLPATHEAFTAILRTFASSPDPAFETRVLQARIASRFAVVDYPRSFVLDLGKNLTSHFSRVHYLYAQRGNQLISGPIDPLAADLITIGNRHAILDRYSTLGDASTLPDVVALSTELHALGLVE